MTGIVLNVDVRDATGTGPARAVRRAAAVPGVLYGGPRGAVAISASEKELTLAIRSGKFLSHVIELEHKGERQQVIPRDIQFHPVTDRPVHFDLFRVEDGTVVKLAVPVKFKNQETSIGIKRGGTLNVRRHEVELMALPKAIPEFIEVDLANVQIGDVVKISSVKLPSGVTPADTSRDFTIASISGRGGPQDADTAE
jgi:large subunit ribosomal protein L25